MEKKEMQSSAAKTAKRHASRRGVFSAGMAALGIVVVLLFNLFLAQIPQEYTQFDMTETGIYDITQTSKEYMANLTDDIEIHVLADKDAMDSRIVRFLNKYEELSDHLILEYTNPAIYPSVLSTYGVETDTIVVTCEATGRQENIAISEIIGYDEMQYYYNNTYVETDFDAEGLLTSAVDGVLSGNSGMAYELSGHGETAVSAQIKERLSKVHVGLESVNLLTDGGIPEDCEMLIINGPVRDLADDELALLLDFLAKGGDVTYCMAGQLDKLPNFEALLSTYGILPAEGMMADTSRYYNNNPYLFFPVVNPDVGVASPFSAKDDMILLYASRGMTLTDPARDTITVGSFLNTSENGVAVLDEENQTKGVYSVGALATEEISEGNTARLTVFGSTSLIDSSLIGSFANLQNMDLFLAFATAGYGDLASVSINAVSLTTPTNTFTTGGIWALLFIFVIPGALLLVGFVHWMRRRKL